MSFLSSAVWPFSLRLTDYTRNRIITARIAQRVRSFPKYPNQVIGIGRR